MEVRPPENKKNVLLAPLDWGLGHATRLIPIIKLLESKGVGVVLAATGRGRELLKQSFPHLPILDLPAYDIKYSKYAFLNGLKILSQVPHILKTMRSGKKLLEKYIREYDLKAVISDNRPELHTQEIPCVYITHQVNVKTGIGILDTLASRLHQSWIRKFDVCWVPDEENDGGLAGALSHPLKKPDFNIVYIGCLSRFSYLTPATKGNKGKMLIILSGPEPQRTILENLICDQLQGIDVEITFVRGLPGEQTLPEKSSGIRFYNHLSDSELKKLIADCDWVVSRCGYSTVMDLTMLQKRAILIPTPGQGEQIYLAKHLKHRGFFHTVVQSELDLKKDSRVFMETDAKPPALAGINEDKIEGWLIANGLIS